MVVSQTDEGGRSDQSIGSWPVLHDHRLFPALRQPICEQTSGKVGAARRRKWHDDAYRPPRPLVGTCRNRRKEACDQQSYTEPGLVHGGLFCCCPIEHAPELLE